LDFSSEKKQKILPGLGDWGVVWFIEDQTNDADRKGGRKEGTNSREKEYNVSKKHDEVRLSDGGNGTNAGEGGFG